MEPAPNEVKFMCRICLEESSRAKDFIVPCLCSGTSKYVHRSCLDRWRLENRNNENYLRCGTCHFHYLIDKDDDQSQIREYKHRLTIEIAKIIGICLVIFCVFAIFLYGLDIIAGERVRSSIMSHFVKTFKFLLAVITIVGFSFIIRNQDQIVRGHSIIACAILGFFCGPFLIYSALTQYYSQKEREIRKQIWPKDTQTISRVHDFSPDGPQRPPQDHNLSSDRTDYSSRNEPFIIRL